MLLKLTLKVIGPQRGREVSGSKQAFLTTTEKTICHSWWSGFSHTRHPCQLHLRLQRTLLGGAGWCWWGGCWVVRGGNEVHLKQLLELRACLTLLSVSACRAATFRARGISNLQRSSSLLPFFWDSLPPFKLPRFKDNGLSWVWHDLWAFAQCLATGSTYRITAACLSGHAGILQALMWGWTTATFPAPRSLHFPRPLYSPIPRETQLPLLHYAEQFNSQTSWGSGPTFANPEAH